MKELLVTCAVALALFSAVVVAIVFVVEQRENREIEKRLEKKRKEYGLDV